MNDINMWLAKNCKSNIRNINLGVPQGSVLGPDLFNFFLNLITKLKLKGKILLFADDICMFYEGISNEEIVNSVSEDLKIIIDWLSLNKLTINLKKTKIMFFPSCSSQAIDNNIQLPLVNNVEIESVNTFKYLGLIFDTKLSWCNHVDFIRKKISPIIGILYRAKNYITGIMRRQIYFSYIHSHINYMCAIWGSANASIIRPLQILQNKALKIVFNKPYRTCTNDLYYDLKIMNIDKCYFNQIVTIYYKIEHKLIKSNLNLAFNNKIYTYNTRQCKNIHIQKTTCKLGQNSFVHR